VGFFEKAFCPMAGPTSTFSKDWATLASFSVVIPFASNELAGLPARLTDGAKLRSGLTLVCRRDYFRNPFYEALVAKASCGAVLCGEDVLYCAAASRRYERLAAEKIGLALLCEDPRESLASATVNEVARIAEQYTECRVISFEREMLILNDGARSLVARGRWTKGSRVLFLEDGRTFSDQEVPRVLQEMMASS
jgi:hypothetical protein